MPRLAVIPDFAASRVQGGLVEFGHFGCCPLIRSNDIPCCVASDNPNPNNSNMPIILQARIIARMSSCWDLPISKKSFISKHLSVRESAMPKTVSREGKAISESTPNARVAFVGFGSHIRNIIRNFAKQ
jgi:hypothetical protein